MREQIKFELVRTKEQFDSLKDFASSDLVHRFDDHSLLPAITLSRAGKQFGWFQVLNQPIVMPSFHTELCSPRDFRDATEQMKAIYQFTSMSERFPNGTVWMAIPPSPMVDENLLRNMGFSDEKRNLWQATPK
jgi:hypothetical protein